MPKASLPVRREASSAASECDRDEEEEEVGSGGGTPESKAAATAALDEDNNGDNSEALDVGRLSFGICNRSLRPEGKFPFSLTSGDHFGSTSHCGFLSNHSAKCFNGGAFEPVILFPVYLLKTETFSSPVTFSQSMALGSSLWPLLPPLLSASNDAAAAAAALPPPPRAAAAAAAAAADDEEDDVDKDVPVP